MAVFSDTERLVEQADLPSLPVHVQSGAVWRQRKGPPDDRAGAVDGGNQGKLAAQPGSR